MISQINKSEKKPKRNKFKTFLDLTQTGLGIADTASKFRGKKKEEEGAMGIVSKMIKGY